MDRYWDFTGETKVWFGWPLKRIVLTKDCIWGKAGDLGGWIESEQSLQGEAWVSDEGKVYGGGVVTGQAWVADEGRVSDKAVLTNEGRVYGEAKLSGSVTFTGELKDDQELKVISNFRLVL